MSRSILALSPEQLTSFDLMAVLTHANAPPGFLDSRLAMQDAEPSCSSLEGDRLDTGIVDGFEGKPAKQLPDPLSSLTAKDVKAAVVRGYQCPVFVNQDHGFRLLLQDLHQGAAFT